MDASKLKTDAITGDKVKDGVITASKFSTGILTDGSIVANSITSDKIKNGTLQAAHLKSNAITGAKFKDGTLTAADFDTSNTDGIFSDGIIATSIHEHNPYNFQRLETNTDFTLLQSSSRGRANFSYRIKDSQTLTDAQETCKNENSQLCDINQLIDICRNSAGVDDAFYFAGEPVLISEKTKDYFVFPMLKDSNNDCFDPEITYDVYAEEPVPVKVNFLTGSSGVHDITSYKGEYFVKINDEVYHDSEAYIALGTSAMANSVHTDNKASAHFVYNSGVSNDSLYMTSSTKIKRISGPSNGSFSFTESTSTYVDIKDLDFFRSASTSIPSSGIILEGSDAYRIVDQNGDAETSSKILLVTAEEKLFPSDDTDYADWQNYQYKYVNEGANFSNSTCDTGSSLAAAHSKAELNHFTSLIGNQTWLNYTPNANGEWEIADGSRTDYLPNDTPGTQFRYTIDSNGNVSTVNQNNSKRRICKKPLTEWPARRMHEAVVHNNKIFVLPGNTGAANRITGVWYSDTNAENWEVYDDTASEDYVTIHLRSDNINGDQIWYNGSGKDFIGSTQGDVVHLDSEKIFGNSSVYFDGDGDSVSYADSSIFDNLSGSDWTFDVYLHPTETSTAKKGIMGRWKDANNYWIFSWDSRSKFVWDYKTTNSNSKVEWDLNGQKDSNKWYHVALTKNGSTYELYLDGTKQTTNDTGNSSFANWSDPITIGQAEEGSNTPYYWEGYMEEARLTIGKRRWTNNFTRPQALTYGMFSARSDYASVVFNNRIWVFGGFAGNNQLNDIWSSADGKVWRQEGNAAWSEREQHTAVVFDDTPNNDSDDPKIFLYGGKTGASSYSNEVWSSTNGVDWTKEDVGGSHWTERSNHQAVVKDGNVYVMGGKGNSSLNNEVWKSSDGHNFTQLSASGHWAARHGFAAVTYDNKIYVIAGETASPATLQKDIWSSSDGIDWTDHGDQAFSARKNFAALVFDSGRSSEIWVLGGEVDAAGGGTTVSNETWHGNFEDFTIKQFEDRKYFDDANQPYTFITYYYDQDRSGTI